MTDKKHIRVLVPKDQENLIGIRQLPKNYLSLRKALFQLTEPIPDHSRAIPSELHEILTNTIYHPMNE